MKKSVSITTRIGHVLLAILVTVAFSVPTTLLQTFAADDTFEITVTKKLEGANIKNYDGAFSFTLTAPDGTTYTAKNDANGKVTFQVPKDKLTEETNEFKVVEEEGPNSDIEYDTVEKTITVKKSSSSTVSEPKSDDAGVVNNAEKGKSQAEQQLVQYAGNGEQVSYNHGNTLGNYITYKTVTDGNGNSYHPFCMVHYKSSSSSDFNQRHRYNENNGMSQFERALTFYTYAYNSSVNKKGAAFDHKDKYKLALKRALWRGYPYNTIGYTGSVESLYQATQAAIFCLGQYGGSNDKVGVQFWEGKSGNKELFHQIYDNAQAAGAGWAPTDQVQLYIHWWNDSAQPLLSAYHPVETTETQTGEETIEAGTATFTNKYVKDDSEEPEKDAGNAQIKAKKILEGADISKYDGAFEFELYPADKDGNITGEVLQTKTNDKKGVVIFDEIEYAWDGGETEKNFYYVVKEKIPEDNDKRANITYSEEEKLVKVTVTKKTETISTGSAPSDPSTGGGAAQTDKAGVSTNIETGTAQMLNLGIAGAGETVAYTHGDTLANYITYKNVDGYHPFCMVHYKSSSSTDFGNRQRFNETNANTHGLYEKVLNFYSYSYNSSVNDKNGPFTHKDKYKLALKRAMWIGYPYNAKNLASTYNLDAKGMYQVTQAVIFALGQTGNLNNTNRVNFWAGKSGNDAAFREIYNEARAAGEGWAPTPGVELYIHWWNDNSQPLLSANYTYEETPGGSDPTPTTEENVYYTTKVDDEVAITNTYEDDEPNIKTTATEKESGEHEAKAEGSVTIVDVVKYENLIAGKEYTMKGELIKKDDKSVLAKAEKKFKPEGDDGTLVSGEVELEFTIEDASALQGTSAVAFEKLYEGNSEIAVHTDIDDEDQTVHFPEIGTKATGEDGKKIDKDKGTVAITDEVSYSNLIAGKEYTLKGRLIKKDDDSEVATAEAKFTAESSNGKTTVTFTFDASSLKKGDELVAFEKLYYADTEIASHEDKEDEGQTVEIIDNKTPTIGTTATVDDQHIASAVGDGTITLVDVVKYSGLEPDTEYVLRAEVRDKAYPVSNTTNGEGLIEINSTQMDNTSATSTDGTHYHATVKTNSEGTGTWKVEFTIDKKKVIGKDTVVFERLFKSDVNLSFPDEDIVAQHTELNDEGQTVHFPDVKTSAKDKQDGNKIVEPTSPARIVDIVSYTNLIPGKEYTVSGTLMDKDTGNPVIDADTEKEVTATKTFTADSASGTVELEFIFNAKLFLEGKNASEATTVVFEELYNGPEVKTEALIAEHKDIDDGDQTIEIKDNIEIGTTATGEKTKDHIAYADGKRSSSYEIIDGKVVLNDVVKYQGLTGGNSYIMKGRLVKKSDQSEVATAEAKFTASRQGRGSVTITFEFDASELDGEDVVAFEKLWAENKADVYTDDTVLATHENIDDSDQTVHFPEAGTKATAYDEDGNEIENLIPYKGTATVVDTVEYKNLIPGKTYTVSGKLVAKEDIVKTINGKETTVLKKGDALVTASKTFTAETADGSVELEFTFDAETISEKGKQVDLVAFERVLLDGEVVAVHEDIEDEEQTVQVEENPEVVVEKTTEAKEVKVGDKIEYNITATNTSKTVTAKDVTIRDEMGKGLKYVSSTSDYEDSKEETSDSVITWKVNEIPAGETVTIIIVCEVTEDAAKGRVVNKAVIPEDKITREGDEIDEETTPVREPKDNPKSKKKGKGKDSKKPAQTILPRTGDTIPLMALALVVALALAALVLTTRKRRSE